MRKKRSHHKSRSGCNECRRRRVKCDEKTPLCTNCTNRCDQCIYPRRTTPETGAAHQNGPFEWKISATSSSAGSNLDPVCSQCSVPKSPASPQGPIAITDAALMHYWSTRTCHSFTREGSELFRDYVGEEALRHNYLLQAIFAVTLLHSASTLDDPAAIRLLVEAALQRQNQSVLALRTTLNGITRSNSDAVFVCSVLIMVCAIISPLLPTGNNDEAPSPAESILLLVEFMNGVSSIVELTRDWIQQGQLHKFFGIVEPAPLPLKQWGPAGDLRKLLDKEPNLNSQKRRTLEHAIENLEKICNRRICAVTWITKADLGFMNELRSGDSIAMMIFMHWGVLLYTSDDMWWKKYAGSRLVKEMSPSFLGYEKDWERMSIWCQQQVQVYE